MMKIQEKVRSDSYLENYVPIKPDMLSNLNSKRVSIPGSLISLNNNIGVLQYEEDRFKAKFPSNTEVPIVDSCLILYGLVSEDKTIKVHFFNLIDKDSKEYNVHSNTLKIIANEMFCKIIGFKY